MAEMEFLTRDAILDSEDIRIEVVKVPEWGGVVRVRGMSGDERDEFEGSLVDRTVMTRAERRRQRRQGKSAETQQAVNVRNVRAKVCAYCIIDAAGERVFRNSDVDILTKKSAAALDRVYEVARDLSGLDEDDIEDMAEAMTNRPFDTSSSDSPTN